MMYQKPQRHDALMKARLLRQKLVEKKFPVHSVILFGSVAKNQQHEWSDIDIAVICDPFRPTALEENLEVRNARRSIDVRISPICLRPDEMNDPYSTIAQEVKRYGIPVE